MDLQIKKESSILNEILILTEPHDFLTLNGKGQHFAPFSNSLLNSDGGQISDSRFLVNTL